MSNRHRSIRCRVPDKRRGLAPLELVLAMPLLMAIMALMIVFGHAAYWKVRGLSVARNAAWSNRWPRTGFDEPAPEPWAPGQFSSRGAADIEALDAPELQHPVVRGPMLGNFEVDQRLLDPSRGVAQGHAEAEIQPAMMPKLKQFKFQLENTLVDGKFQYPQMGLPGNETRRIPVLYSLPKADASISQAWVAATLAVMNAPFRGDLDPLDHDEEIHSYYGYYPDFHPRLSRFCSLDLLSVWQNQTRQLIGRIKGRQRPRVQGVPERMASFWISMYQSQINGWQSQINGWQMQIDGLRTEIAGLDPVTDAARILQAQAEIDSRQGQITTTQGEIDALQPDLDVLRAFRTRARQVPDTADGPVPPLAMLGSGDGTLATADSPLHPIPAELLGLMAPLQRACCGQVIDQESQPRQFDLDPYLREWRP